MKLTNQRACLITVLACLQGCAGMLANRIIEAPNQLGLDQPADVRLDFVQAFNLTEGRAQSSTGELAYLSLSAQPMTLAIEGGVSGLPDGEKRLDMQMNFAPGGTRPPNPQAIGTVVATHGFGLTKAGGNHVVFPNHAGARCGELMPWLAQTLFVTPWSDPCTQLSPLQGVTDEVETGGR